VVVELVVVVVVVVVVEVVELVEDNSGSETMLLGAVVVFGSLCEAYSWVINS
jgi:hypothetical protein